MSLALPSGPPIAASRGASPAIALLRGLVLAGSLLGAAILGTTSADEAQVTQAILWLPTGIAIAGLWLLGLRATWAVAAGTMLHRLSLDYDVSVVIPESLGSCGEAVVGVWLLRRLGLQREFARLRDVGALVAAAGIAPLVSMLASFVGRSLPGTSAHELPLLSGWCGWWRMNALGALTVAPLVLTWSAWPRARLPLRAGVEATGVMVATVGLLAAVMTGKLGSGTAIPLLYAVLPIALWSALRFGPRGATSVASLSALFVVLATQHGIGPFLAAPLAERHVGAQIFGLTLVAVPLVFGALVAEREATAQRSRRLEAQLRQAQKLEAVGKLAGGVAHDFNNLLTAIRGNAEMLREAGAGDAAAEQRRSADDILFAAERGASLTRQLLAFSRQQHLSPQTLDLGVLVEHLGALLRRLIGADIELVTTVDGPAPICADRSQIEQVLLNLAVNARDAMRAGGRLTIATSNCAFDAAAAAPRGLEPGDHVELTVRDNGSGMAAEVQARAFEPFFTTKDQGTGLGLATVYGIVKQSGGAIALESAPGRGTTVRIWLRRVAAPPTDVPLPVLPAAGVGVGTVLLVEDEAAVRDLLRRGLERAGYTVLVCEDGDRALQVAAAQAPRIDLLITDVVMPRIGGLELARRIATGPAPVPVLFVSGHVRDAAGIDLAGFAAADFLQKPFARSELLARAAALLARGRQRPSPGDRAPPSA